MWLLHLIPSRTLRNNDDVLRMERFINRVDFRYPVRVLLKTPRCQHPRSHDLNFVVIPMVDSRAFVAQR
jgi:hypothetical protein